jgi:hypothetical protein
MKSYQIKRLKELELENARLRRAVLGQTLDTRRGELLNPARSRGLCRQVEVELKVSER